MPAALQQYRYLFYPSVVGIDEPSSEPGILTGGSCIDSSVGEGAGAGFVEGAFLGAAFFAAFFGAAFFAAAFFAAAFLGAAFFGAAFFLVAAFLFAFAMCVSF